MRTINNLRFLPSEPSKLGNLRAYLKGYSRPSAYNWGRHKKTPVYKRNKKGNWINKPPTLNKVTLGNISGALHHLSSHAPEAVRAKWKAADERFRKHHAPYVHGRTNARWHNKVTAGGWL